MTTISPEDNMGLFFLATDKIKGKPLDGAIIATLSEAAKIIAVNIENGTDKEILPSVKRFHGVK